MFLSDGSASAGTTVLGLWRFETGATCTAQGWTSVDLAGGFGDFAALQAGTALVQVDPCARDLMCAWTFIAGSPDDFACGGFPAQPAIPRGSPATGYIWNEIVSPAVAMKGTGSDVGLEFAVYRQLDLAGLVFYTFRVRSHTAGGTGPWRGPAHLYYSPLSANDAGDWMTQRVSIGAFVDPGADSIQVALGVVDMAGAWGGLLGTGDCHSHAPVFDGVRVWRVASVGPRWSVDPADLFQDAFAEDGTNSGTVRIDMARDVNPRDVATIRAGDSLVVSVNEPTVGLDHHVPGDPASGPAVYLHVRDVSAAASGAVISDDLARWPLVSSGGGWTVLRFDSVRAGSAAMPGRFCVDLNDALYRPGDRVDFYFSARDALGRTTTWSELSQAQASSYPMEMTCLPAGDGSGRRILYVDDADGFGAQFFFETAFLATGVADEVDRYDVRCPDGLVGNGPGSRVRNAHQLASAYDSIIWSSSVLGHGLIGDGTGAPEKSPDAQLLVEYLALKVEQGFVYLNGDNLAVELDRLQSPAAVELKRYLNYRLTAHNHRSSYGISPLATAVSGGALDSDPSFVVYGGCPLINQFDVMEPLGSAVTEVTYGPAGAVNGAIVSQRTNGRWVILGGFGFEFIRDNDSNGEMDRAALLADMLVSREPPAPCAASRAWLVAGSSQVEINWRMGTCPGQQGGHIVRRFLPDGPEETIHEFPVPPLSGSFIDSEPGAGDYVSYQVFERFAGGSGVRVDSTAVLVAGKVTGMAAVPADVAIAVSWTIDDRAGLTGLTLARRAASGGTFAPVGQDSILSPGTSRHHDNDVEPAETYDYRLMLHYGEHTAPGATAQGTAPDALALAQNAPNPFNPTTTIRFLLPAAGPVTIVVYDAGGRRVRALANSVLPAGPGAVVWDGHNERGAPVASGVYFYRMTALGTTITRKMILVK